MHWGDTPLHVTHLTNPRGFSLAAQPPAERSLLVPTIWMAFMALYLMGTYLLRGWQASWRDLGPLGTMVCVIAVSLPLGMFLLRVQRPWTESEERFVVGPEVIGDAAKQPIVEFVRGIPRFVFPACAPGSLERTAYASDLQGLVEQGIAARHERPGLWWVEIPTDTQYSMVLGGLTVCVHRVVPDTKHARGRFTDPTLAFACMGSAVATVVLIAVICHVKARVNMTSTEEWGGPERAVDLSAFVQARLREPEPVVWISQARSAIPAPYTNMLPEFDEMERVRSLYGSVGSASLVRNESAIVSALSPELWGGYLQSHRQRGIVPRLEPNWHLCSLEAGGDRVGGASWQTRAVDPLHLFEGSIYAESVGASRPDDSFGHRFPQPIRDALDTTNAQSLGWDECALPDLYVPGNTRFNALEWVKRHARRGSVQSRDVVCHRQGLPALRGRLLVKKRSAREARRVRTLTASVLFDVPGDVRSRAIADYVTVFTTAPRGRTNDAQLIANTRYAQNAARRSEEAPSWARLANATCTQDPSDHGCAPRAARMRLGIALE